MKKTILILMLVFAVAATLPSILSCNKIEPDPEQKDEPKDEPEPKPEGPQPGMYTFTASTLMGSWKAGDRIHIHGAYGPAAKIFTLEASDISEDGRTASVRLDDVLEFPWGPDAMYAAWPGEAVKEEDGMMTESTEFDSFDIPLALAYLSGTEFTFKDISTCLKFQVSGYSDFVIAGNLRPGLRFTSYSATYSSEETRLNGRKDDGYPFLAGTVTNGSVELWIPGPITLKKGFTIFLGNGEEWPMVYTVSEDATLKAGEITDLGDISGDLTPYTGPDPKMPEMGARKKFTVKVAELSGLYMSSGNDFIWGVGDEGDLVKLSFDGEVISSVFIDGDCEAITIDPTTGDLLIGTEPNTVYRVAAPSFDKKVKLFSIADAKGYGNSGQEGLTYYKDGLIYSGMQTGSELYCINLESGEVLWKKNLRQIFPVITEIADLCYDPLTDWLWIIDSEAKKFFALSGDAEKILGAYSVKTISNPESICIDHAHSCIWVGDDYGDNSYLYRYDFTGLDDAIIVQE